MGPVGGLRGVECRTDLFVPLREATERVDELAGSTESLLHSVSLTYPGFEFLSKGESLRDDGLGGRVCLNGGIGGRGPDQLVREPVQVRLELRGGALDLVLVVQRGSGVGAR